ncbi:MAG: SRPBCC family protein [Pseudomonadota bacterium]|nr:SRPBCC family protein [Pseudomonadota bacterium]
MADYEFVTVWAVPAPVATVWEEIRQPLRWPVWWRGLLSVAELEPGEPGGLNRLYRFVWRSPLLYRLTLDIRVCRIEPPFLLEGMVSGDLVGEGLWLLTAHKAETVVQFDWRVSGPQPWMRRLAPLARPLFRWNHNRLMAHGRQGLARQVAAGNRK